MKHQVIVFLDTNILPRSPARLGSGFKRLAQLSDAGLIKIYLSEIVIAEWRSQLQDEFYKTIDEANRVIKKTLKHPWIDEFQILDIFRNAQEKIENSEDRIPEITRKKIEELLSQLKPEILIIKEHHGKSVVDSYFLGGPPFGGIKNRDDFPDAFIFQSLKDLSLRVQVPLHCIIADKGLGNAITQIDNVILYRSIDEFVKSEMVEQKAREQEVERLWQDILEKMDHSQELELEKEIRYSIENLIYDELALKIVSHKEIPADNKQATVTRIGEPDKLIIDWKNKTNYGPGLITVPFELEIDVSVEFMVFRGDAFNVPEGVWVDIGDFEKDFFSKQEVIFP